MKQQAHTLAEGKINYDINIRQTQSDLLLCFVVSMDSSWGAFSLMAGYCKGFQFVKLNFSTTTSPNHPLDFVDLEAFGA
jgi:hypothetical protein